MPFKDINGNFVGYSSARKPENIPMEMLVESDGCFVHNGIIKQRRAFYELAAAKQRTVRCNGFSEWIRTGANELALIIKYIDDAAGKFEYVLLYWTLGASPTAPVLVSLEGPVTGTFINMKTAIYNNMLYVVDSRSPGKKYNRLNSDEWVDQGLRTAVIGNSSNDGAVSGAGSGTSAFPEVGTYSYRMSFLYEPGATPRIEGQYSNEQSATITAITDIIPFTTYPANWPSHVTGYILYRKNPGQDQWFKLWEGGTTPATVNDVGAATDATTPLPQVVDENGVGRPKHTQSIASPRSIALHSERMFFADADEITLWFSEPGLPESVPTVNFFLVGENNDPFTEIISARGALIIVKRHSIWLLQGDNPLDFVLEQVESFGSFCTFMTFGYQDFLYYANDTGLYRTTLQGDPERLSDQILLDWETFDLTNMAGWTYAIDPETQYIYFYVHWTDTNYHNQKCLVFDPVSGVFKGSYDTKTTYAKTIITPSFDSAILEQKYNSTADQHLLTMYDNHTKILSADWTAETSHNFKAALGHVFDTQQPLVKRLYRNVRIEYQADANDTFNVKVELPPAAATLLKSHTLTAASRAVTNFNLGRTEYTVGIWPAQDTAMLLATRLKIASLRVEYDKGGKL